MDNQMIWNFADEGYLRCSVEHLTAQEQQWLASVRIYFMLSGHMVLRTGTRSHRLDTDDVFFINKQELFAITEADGIAAVYDLNISHVDHNFPDLWFNFRLAGSGDSNAAVVLKEFLARFIKFNLDSTQDQTYLNRSLYYAIVHHLISFFRVEKPQQATDNPELLDRVEQIAKYIDRNFRNELKLDELAAHFYLSVPYMSKLFKRHFGTTFSEYLTNIRLQSSLQELRFGQKSIEDISALCGFPSARSYISFFKKKHGVTPGEYRRRFQKEDGTPAAHSSIPSDISHSHKLELLTKYLQNDEVTEAVASSLPTKLTESPVCDIKKDGTFVPHNFRKLTAIGSASDLLSAENQNMLRTLQQEVGFEYIIFHGLLDDDMMVYNENTSGQPELNFGYIDIAFDFLRSIGLKPFVELSYMPRLLAASGFHLTNSGRSCIGLPKRMDIWALLVRRFVNHMNDRYGYREVASWPFTLWNAPDSGDAIFGIGTVQEYFDFYRATVNAAKNCNPDIRFCGPSCLTDTMESGAFLTEFLGLCQTHNCLPDMLCYHFYPVNFNNLQHGSVRTEPHLSYRPSPNALHDSIHQVRRQMESLPGQIQTLHISEWNASISHRELLSDTAFQAAYVVKNILENQEAVDSLCYWTLSDSIKEVRLTNRLYHGGLGLFTYNGIKKASYQAFRLLSKLGNTKLDAGDGYYICRSDNSVQILLYNYQHYSQLYADGELFDMTFLNRYTPFLNPTNKKFSLPVTGLKSGKHLVTETILNPAHGSSFDKWVELGALPLQSKEDFDYLQSVSIPKMQKRMIDVKEDSMDFSATLEPHEVRLIEIQFSYES